MYKIRTDCADTDGQYNYRMTLVTTAEASWLVKKWVGCSSLPKVTAVSQKCSVKVTGCSSCGLYRRKRCRHTRYRRRRSCWSGISIGLGTVTSHWPRACIKRRPASSARSSGGNCVTCVLTVSASHTIWVMRAALRCRSDRWTCVTSEEWTAAVCSDGVSVALCRVGR